MQQTLYLYMISCRVGKRWGGHLAREAEETHHGRVLSSTRAQCQLATN